MKIENFFRDCVVAAIIAINFSSLLFLAGTSRRYSEENLRITRSETNKKKFNWIIYYRSDATELEVMFHVNSEGQELQHSRLDQQNFVHHDIELIYDMRYNISEINDKLLRLPLSSVIETSPQFNLCSS